MQYSISLVWIFAILLYGSAGYIAFRKLLPRLSPLAIRLAIAFLVAQVAMLAVALTIERSTGFERWLWDLDQERNIPATLAAVQLAMVGGVAMINAWRNAARASWWHCLYFVAFGWLFLHLARSEYYSFHEFKPDVRFQYAVAGAAAVLISLRIGWKTSSDKRVWYFLLVSGIAISSFGAYVLEQFRSLCIQLPAVGECVWSFYYEETLEFLGIWLVLVAMLGLFSQRPRPARLVSLFLYLFPLLTLLLLLLPFVMNRIAYRYRAASVDVSYEADVRLRAYRLEIGTSSVDVQIFMSALSWHAYTKLGYSVQLVDQVTGASLVGVDRGETRRHGWRIALYDTSTRYHQWLRLDTSAIPTNRALWIVLTFWRESGKDFVRQEVRASGLPLLSDTQVILGEFVLPDDAPATASSTPLALFDTGYSLGTVSLPEVARVGEPMEIAFAWRADRRGTEDLIQFLHIGHSHTGKWHVFDQLPLGARLPPRLWYPGMTSEETWHVPLPANLAPGRYMVFTGLYSASTQMRVSVTDATGTPWPDNRVELGSLLIE